MKTARKGRRDSYISIRSKLMAAVAMLLVASFMVVSSSYAWFTLSTAPEVKGIQTSVGSNGNLEIALYTGQDEITSGVGDGLESNALRYETWGNLINLSDAQYGLSKIKLNPARLNVTESNTVQGSALMTPVYAADGRVTELQANTITGTYNNTTKNAFVEYVGDEGQKQYGVRGIGNASTMNQMQLDYRNALNAAKEALESANSNVALSLDGAGSDLASFAVKRVMTPNPDSYDLTNLASMLNKLEIARQKLDTAILSFIQADVASDYSGQNEDTYNSAKDIYYKLDVTKMTTADMTVEGKTNEEVLTEWVTAVVGTDTNHILNQVWTHRNYINTAITHANAEYEALGENVTTATWVQLRGVLNGLVDLNEVLVNGLTTDAIKNDTGALVDSYVNTGKLVVTISVPESNMTLVEGEKTLDFGKGAYIEFAMLTDNVSATIALRGLVYNGKELSEIPATMNTNVEGAPTVKMTANFPTEPTSETQGAATIDDLYGYIVDLAFRTNAKDSQLCLQTEAVDRIYAGGTTNTETLGYGSTMVFNYDPTASYGKDDILNLMKHIRIVFTNTLGGDILGVAGLDTLNSTTLESDNKVSAPVKLYDTATYTLTSAGFKEKENAVLGFKAPDSDGKTPLTSLTQNQVEKISVYVYLDGDSVENKDVAAETLYSATGALNLQFSSTASLKPMEYSPLKGTLTGGGTGE